MNRVVITGMGAISPVGSDIETIYESLSTGRCGVGKITRFAVSYTHLTLPTNPAV